MKYDSRYSEDDNVYRWQGHAEDNDPACPYDQLPLAVQVFAQRVNDLLTRQEIQARQDATRVLADLLLHPRDADDMLEDFDIVLCVRFGLREDDAEWQLGDANLLCVHRHSLRAACDPQLAGGVRPANSGLWAGWPTQAPCPTFVSLMETSGIAWADLPRIGYVRRRLVVQTDHAPYPLDPTR